jgi:hypothetical protein
MLSISDTNDVSVGNLRTMVSESLDFIDRTDCEQANCISCNSDREELNDDEICDRCQYVTKNLSTLEANDVEIGHLTNLLSKAMDYIDKINSSKVEDIIELSGGKEHAEKKCQLLQESKGINEDNVCKICESVNFSIHSFCDNCLLKCKDVVDRQEIYKKIKKVYQFVADYQVKETNRHKKYAKEFWESFDTTNTDNVMKVRSKIKRDRIQSLIKAEIVHRNTSRQRSERITMDNLCFY